MFSIIIRAFVMIFLGLAPASLALAEDTESAMRQVVILSSSDAGLPAFIAVDQALQATVRELSSEPVGIFVETLDFYRFGSAEVEEKLEALLEARYQDLRVDVLVAYGSDALKFAQRYREDIWPGAAIVFNSVSKEALVGMELAQRTAGVSFEHAFGGTIDLALTLRPSTKRITVVAGTAAWDRMMLSKTKASLQPYLKMLDVEYLVGLTLDETVAGLQALPPDAIVLYLTVFRDASVVPLVPQEVLKRVAAE